MHARSLFWGLWNAFMVKGCGGFFLFVCFFYKLLNVQFLFVSNVLTSLMFRLYCS